MLETEAFRLLDVVCTRIYSIRIQLTVVLQCDWLRAWVINHLLPMLLWIISWYRVCFLTIKILEVLVGSVRCYKLYLFM